MGLRCLIGHDYGDPQTSRDRSQRGSEVVVTVEEYRECDRCGHRRIISENKEVKAESPAEPASAPSVAPAGPTPAESADDDSDPGDDAEADLGGDSAPEPLSADEDDGIILEDGPDEPARRGYGEWPATDLGEEGPDELTADHDPWPTEEADADASPPGSDPFDPDTSVDASSTGPTVSQAVDSTPGAESPVEPADGASTASTPTPPPDPSDAELVCPDCRDTWPSVNVSLRPGDICPACRGGYLEERVIQ